MQRTRVVGGEGRNEGASLGSLLSALHPQLSTLNYLGTGKMGEEVDKGYSDNDKAPGGPYGPPGASWFKEELLVASTRRG